MKKSFKGFIACLLAALLIVPVIAGAVTEAPTLDGTGIGARETASPSISRGTALQSKNTASIDLSGIRNGRTFKAAETEAQSQVAPDEIVTIMVELEAAPAADVVADLRAADGYRAELVAAQNVMIGKINSALNINIVPTHHYSVLFNGFAFEGEYRLVAAIDAMDGVHAFVSPVWESPELFNTTTQVGAVDAWELGYTGAGYAVAIIDTGCKVDHPAFSNDPEEVQFTRDDIAAVIASGQLQGSGSTMNVSNVYVSGKIPFQWNYYYNHADASHPGTSDHGTHVAGIAAGNGGEIRGVAPDAQICVMQVFAPAGGASWSNIVPALEDAAVLGVSAANLSLGSPCGTDTPYDPSITQTLGRCVNAGVNLAMAAGNDYDSSFNNVWGGNEGTPSSYSNTGYALAADPDIGVVGSPSTWPQSLSVAAVSNTKQRFYFITVEGNDYSYSENSANPVLLRNALGGQTVPYVMVPGYGTEEDFAQVDVSGKVALVSRGEINFVAKAANAEAAGAVACIVYNNVDASINMVAYEGGHIPHVIISKTAGEALAAAENKEMTIGEEQGIFDNPDGNKTTSFSSRGLTASMSMKPEITAPGGQIYSSTDPAISNTWYDTWDGTSMATPHVCGGMAIVTEYVDVNFPNLSAAEKQYMVDRILMSTATPILSDSGDYAAVHEQGAGLMNLTKATTTKAYITVEGTQGNRPKLELGDDPEKTGTMTMTFTVHNFGEAEQTYTINPTVLLNDIAMLGTMAGEPVIVYYGGTYKISGDAGAKLLGDANGDGRIGIADAVLIMRHAMGLITLPNAEDCDLNGDGEVTLEDAVIAARIAMGLMDPVSNGGEVGEVTFDMPSSVTVPAGGSTEVTINAAMSAYIKDYINAYYPSGALVEGFIELMPASEDDVSLTVPFIKFFGDWNYPATIDRGYYYEDVQWNSNNYPNTAGYRKSNTVYGLGINPYVETEDLSYYLADRNAISPNNDGKLDTVNLVYTGLLRNSAVRYLVLNANGSQIDQISNLGVMNKGFWKDTARRQLGVTDGAFPTGINFTQYGEDDLIIRIETTLDNNGTHGTNAATIEANENPVWDIPVAIDTTNPVVSDFAAANGHFTFNVTDEHYVAYVGIYTQDGDALGELVAEQGLFETERGAVTAIDLEGQGNVYVIVADYAMNEQIYSWDGTNLTPIEGVEPPAPVVIPDVSFYAYGKNLNTKTWIKFASTNLESLSYGGGIQSDDGDYTCATYTGRYVYAVTANKELVRYDAADIDGWTNKTTIGTINVGYTVNEMAYNKVTGKLYIVYGLSGVAEVNVETAAITEIGDCQYGIAAIDFDRNGNCYIVDAFGEFCTFDLESCAPTALIGDGYGFVPYGDSGFFVQGGTISGDVFFWFAADSNAEYYADMHLLAINMTTGEFIDMGAVYGGLYCIGLFAYSVEPPVSTVDPVDFYDNFENGFHWDLIDADGDGLNWGAEYFGQGLYQDGSKCAVSYSYTQEQGAFEPDNWMISPEFTVGDGERFLSFFTASANPATGDISEHYQVLIVPEGVDPQEGTVIFDTIMDTNACTEHVLDISAYAGQNIRLAFRHYDCYDQYTLIIDSIGVGPRK